MDLYMKYCHSRQLRPKTMLSYTIETFPEQNGRRIMHIIHKETGEEVAVF